MIIKKIRLEDLQPNLWNPNEMSEEQEKFLEREYKRIGYVQPILVRPLPDNKYQIIDGEHRWKVARKVGLREIECVVVELSEEEAKLTTINMNKIKGVDNPIKLAELLEDLKNSDKSLLDLVAMEEGEIKSLIEVMNEREIDIEELEKTREKQPKLITCPKCGYEIEV